MIINSTSSGYAKRGLQALIAGVLMTGLVSTASCKKDEPTPDPTPTPTSDLGFYSYSSTEVSFKSADGLDMPATLYRPLNATSKCPAIVFMNGSGNGNRDGSVAGSTAMPPIYQRWADTLAKMGFVVLRYDKRLVSHAQKIEPQKFDQNLQASDGTQAVKYLSSKADEYQIDAAKILVLGHSEGAGLANLIAKEAPEVRAYVMVNGPFIPIDSLLCQQLITNGGLTEAQVKPYRDDLAKVRAGTFPNNRTIFGVGATYWSQWIDLSENQRAKVEALDKPVLIIQSLADENFVAPYLERSLKQLDKLEANPKTDRKIVRIANGTHSMFQSVANTNPDWRWIASVREWYDAMTMK